MALSNNDIIQVAKAVAADVSVVEHHGDLTLVVKATDLLDVLYELKDNPRTTFNLLIDITAIDWAKPGERYEVVYFLSFLANAARLRKGGRARRRIAPSYIRRCVGGRKLVRA